MSSSDNPSPIPNPTEESIQETATGSDNNTLEDSQPVEDSHDDPAELSVEEEEEVSPLPPPPLSPAARAEAEECSGRERLKRHQVEMAGRVWIPDMWGQEGLLKEWADCTNFDASLVRSRILMARDSMANDGRRRVHSTEVAVHNSC